MKKLVLACALLILPAAAWADGAYRWELTPTVSYHFGGSLNTESELDFVPDDVELDQGVVYGLTFDIPLSSNLQLEFLLNAHSADLFFDGGVFGPDLEVSEIDVTYAHIGLLAQFGRPEMTPYFVGSLGATQLDAEGESAGADNKFSVSLGGGVKMFFIDHFGLRLEGRYYWTQLDNWEVSCGANNCYDARDYLSQFHASVGLIFAW